MKFLVFIAAIVSIWYVMRWIRQAETTHRAQQARQAPKLGATDTVVCSRCAIYVPANHLTACSRRDCPFPRA